MDILATIKENLPEGVEVSEKALKAIEKEIKQQQGLEFVPKSQYSKKVETIDEMKAEITELLGKAAEADTYKQKVASLDDEYKSYKATKEQEFNDFKSAVEIEKTAATKQSILRKQLTADGANADLVDLLELKFDIAKIELDGDKIKGWEEISKPIKEQYSKVFGTVETVGVVVATPPAGNPQSSYTIEQIKTMTPAQINENWDKGVKQALEKGK